MWTELRQAIRALIRGRLFSLVVVACLAAGIASNTTMFSVFDAIFWRPLPFPDAADLVTIRGKDPHTGRSVALSLDDVETLRSLPVLSALAAYSGRTSTLTDRAGESERVSTQRVTPNLFTVLGASPERGRAFGIEAQSPDEFLCNLFDLDPEGFAEMLREQASDLQNPPVTFEELLDRLARTVPDLVVAVREYLKTGNRA